MSIDSRHAEGVAQQIEQAVSIEALEAAAQQIDHLIVRLHGDGVPIEAIAEAVSGLNAQLIARLWSFVAAPEVVANSCLIVMGSEGRGEQILKTDQDNALLLRDGFGFVGIEAVAQRFNAALAGFGYPPCPGDIMLTNPLWRQPLGDFREALRNWVYGADPRGVMHLAIFVDAVAVVGDAGLLQEARHYLETILTENDVFLARFAQAADQFAEPHWWTWLAAWRDEKTLDLKKLGTFPIVHGARALALQHRIEAPGTASRLQALADQGHLDPALARDQLDALHFLMTIKLEQQLHQRQTGEPASNQVALSRLGTLERERLEMALASVGRFRQHLRQHFRLDLL